MYPPKQTLYSSSNSPHHSTNCVTGLGAYQLALPPISASTEGTNTHRTTVASSTIVRPIPTPICFNSRISAARKPPTAVHSSSAAIVTDRALVSMPRATA